MFLDDTDELFHIDSELKSSINPVGWKLTCRRLTWCIKAIMTRANNSDERKDRKINEFEVNHTR
jgi:hypothetical protein